MKKILLILPILIITLFFSCNDVLNNERPVITSFNIPSKSITGIINNNTITINVEDGFDYSTPLTPEIGVTNGGTVSPKSGVPQDFSITPLTYTVYGANGQQSVYNIIVKEEVPLAQVGDIFISEVFKGTKSESSTGAQIENNYIELYNSSDSDFDLSQFSLKLEDSESSADRNLDLLVELIGTIEAHSTFTIYNKDIDTSLLNSLNLIKSSDKTVSDLYLNGITEIDKSDKILLLQNGVVVDLFDPTDGKENYTNYLNLKKFVRRGGKRASTTWKDSDWILYGITETVTDDDSVGVHEAESSLEAMNFTYFAFEEGFPEPVVGVIDNNLKTISVTLPGGTDVTSLAPVFGTSGNKVTVSSITQKNGISYHEFTQDIVYTVWAQNGGTKSYTVSIGSFSYTPENYSFNGNIKAVLDAMILGESNVTSLSGIKDPEYSGASGTVTGVVTAKDIYGYKTATKCFFLQDKDAGLYIFTNEGLGSDVELGTKITLNVSEGKVYFGMPEVTSSSSYTIVERNVPIYYKTGNYGTAEAIGQVYLFEGSIQEAMDGNSVGQFNSELYFHSSNNFEDSLQAGATGKFYGPVTFAYEKYRIEINSPYQITE